MAKYPAMATISTTKRSRGHRFGDRARGALLLGKNVLLTVVVLTLLAGGVWTSWDTAQHAMFTKGRVTGTMTVRECGEDVCTGPFTPQDATLEVRSEVTVDASVTDRKPGEILQTVVRPGTDRVVRTGPAGILYAWVPLGGALLLATLVLAGGLGMRRTGSAAGVLGVTLIAVAFWLV